MRPAPAGRTPPAMWTWDFFVQQFVNGLTLGSVYALIAIGYSMVYGILKLLNFAHGEVYMIGAFIGYGVLVGCRRRGEPDRSRSALLLPFMFIAAMIGCRLLGVVHRALRVPAAAQRAADRAADHRARRLVLPPELGAPALLRRLPHLRHVRPRRRRALRQGHPLTAR